MRVMNTASNPYHTRTRDFNRTAQKASAFVDRAAQKATAFVDRAAQKATAFVDRTAFPGDEAMIDHAIDQADRGSFRDIGDIAQVLLRHAVLDPECAEIIPKPGFEAVIVQPGVQQPVEAAMTATDEIAQTIFGIQHQ